MDRPHRWVSEEPHIPFDIDVVYEDAGIIVIDKPHFLATTPRGMQWCIQLWCIYTCSKKASYNMGTE